MLGEASCTLASLRKVDAITLEYGCQHAQHGEVGRYCSGLTCQSWSTLMKLACFSQRMVGGEAS